MELWLSELTPTGLVAVSLVEPGAHPACPVGMPPAVRVLDEPTAEVAEQLLRDAAATAAAAEVPLRLDLDDVVARAERAVGPGNR